MRRKNPLTGKSYKTGDIREDGKIFFRWEKIRGKDGFFLEHFLSKKEFNQLVPKIPINIKTKKECKFGEEMPNGRIYIGFRYQKKSKKMSIISLTKKDFKKRNKNNNKKKKIVLNGKYRINPDTKKIWERGDIRKSDHFIFDRHVKYSLDSQGYYPTSFITKEDHHKQCILAIIRRNKHYGLKSNLDSEYLLKIFPKNSLCPALKIKMKWNKIQGYDSPTLDKINPKKGYFKGNVVFLSFRANRIKSNATSKEVLKVGYWLKKN